MADVMRYPYNEYLKVRLEFVLLRDDDLQARIMRIIENWMIWQKKQWENDCVEATSNDLPLPPEPDYYISLSYAQIMSQLYMFNSSRKGEERATIEGKKNAISRNTIGKAMATLVADKYVLTRPNPDPSKEFEATQYKLNCDLIEQHMKLLPKNPLAYLGSNGRIDGVPCPNFLAPPPEIPHTNFVHGRGDAQNLQGGMHKNFTSPYPNSGGGDAQNLCTLIDNTNRLSNRESNDNTIVHSADASAQPSQVSLSIEQLIELCRAKGLTVSLPTSDENFSHQSESTQPDKTHIQEELPSDEEANSKDDTIPITQRTEMRVTKREGKTEKPPKATRAQIEKGYLIITDTKKRLYEDPEYEEIESARSTRALTKLIQAKGTPAMLALVIEDMWNEKDREGRYWWRENQKRMSVTAICDQYPNRASALRLKLSKKHGDEQQGEQPATPNHLGKNSVRPELQRYVDPRPAPTTEWRNPNKKGPHRPTAVVAAGAN